MGEIMAHWSEKLPDFSNKETLEWCKSQPSLAAAWRIWGHDKIKIGFFEELVWGYGSSMIFMLAQNLKQGSPRHRKIVLLLCKCAQMALTYVPESTKSPRDATDLAERWANSNKSMPVKQLESAINEARTYLLRAKRVAFDLADECINFPRRTEEWAVYAAFCAAFTAADAVSIAPWPHQDYPYHSIARKAEHSLECAACSIDRRALYIPEEIRGGKDSPCRATENHFADMVRESFDVRNVYRALRTDKWAEKAEKCT